MALRNVLMLTYHFPPSAASGSFRLLGFARHLPRHGWRATVVAPPSIPWEPVDPALCEAIPAETVVHRVPYPSSRLARRFVGDAAWLAAAWPACRRALREQRPDAILTSGPPQEIHWLGAALAARSGLPWVADFRDPWFPRGRTERGRDLASWRVAVQERAVMARASAVVANAPGACQVLRAAYPKHRRKFVTLPNGYDREAFASLPGPPPADERALRIVHTGAIYVGRDPRPVLDAIKLLSERGRCDLEADFYGPPPDTGLDLAAEANLRGVAERVMVAGQVPYARCLAAMAAADILLLMDSPGRTVGVPAKLYEYLGAGRPILALGERGGDLEWVLRQSGATFAIATPGDSAGTVRALAALADAARGPVAPECLCDRHRFSREAIAGRLATVLDRCLGAREGQPDTTADHDAEPGHAPPDDAGLDLVGDTLGVSRCV